MAEVFGVDAKAIIGDVVRDQWPLFTLRKAGQESRTDPFTITTGNPTDYPAECLFVKKLRYRDGTAVESGQLEVKMRAAALPEGVKPEVGDRLVSNAGETYSIGNVGYNATEAFYDLEVSR